jgi:hypothetical protein
VTVTPPAVSDVNVSVRIDFYGTTIQASSGGSAPTAAAWPGPGSYQIKITVTTGASPPPPPPPAPAKPADASTPAEPAVTPLPVTPAPPTVETALNKSGVWSLFHLLDDAARGGNAYNFYSGGQTYKVQFSAPSASNPLNLSAVRQFQCPTNI